MRSRLRIAIFACALLGMDGAYNPILNAPLVANLADSQGTAAAFSRASTAAHISDAGGTVVDDASGAARYEYTSGFGGTGLLIEGQVTNYLGWSEQMNQWGSGGAAVTTNSTAAPDGTTTADTVTDDSGAAAEYIYAGGGYGGAMGAQPFSMSVWFKADSAHTASLWLTLYGGGCASTQRRVDVSVTTSWQRFTSENLVSTDPTCTTTQMIIWPVDDSDAALQGSVYAWGAVVEASAITTSYIETTGSSAVTRVADSAVFPRDDGSLNVFQGSASVAFSPAWDSTESVGTPFLWHVSGTLALYYDAASDVVTATGGGGATVSTDALSFAADEAATFTLDWFQGKPLKLTMADVGSWTSAANYDAGAGPYPAYLYVGSNASSASQAFGRFNGVRVMRRPRW